jgi:hypothetical protein
MAKAQEVYDFLIKYMDNYGGASNNWYAGITSDVEQRLFSEHGVSRQGRWAHHTADSEKGARNVEEALLKIGCDGGTGGGLNPCTVYVYWKTSNTVE